ncbi:MAG TPA: type II secretion system protein GspG [Chthoniobacteraceae bacterium]
MGAKPRRDSSVLFKVALVAMAVAILCIGVLILSPGGSYHEGRTLVEARIASIATALERYHSLAGIYPSTEQGLQALVVRPTSEPVPSDWSIELKDTPLDRWAQPFHYQYPGTHNPGSFDVWSSGPDKQTGTPDDIGNWK